MPGIPLVTRETSQLRSEDNISPQNSRLVLSPEEEIAAERSLSVYCKPVELYNILRSRATDQPLFLQRCLKYKIQKKHHRRIQMTVSLSGALGNGFQVQSLFPLDTYLATLVPDFQSSEIEIYHFSATRSLTTSNMREAINQAQAQAQFTLPEMSKLAVMTKTRSLFILFISYAVENSSFVEDREKDRVEASSIPTKVGKYCLWGKIPLEPIISSWERSPNLSHGQRVQIMSAVELHVSHVKFALDKERQISFYPSYNSSVNTSHQVEVTISTEEVGAIERSPYNSSIYKSSVSSSCPVLRLRTGNVIFNYRYYNNKLQRSEVTEDFSCPFCLVKCGSFKGLRCHLSASHDLFNFEFWVTEEYQAVNVSVKTDSWRPEIIGEGVDPKQQTFFLCSKPLRWKRRKRSVCEPNSMQQTVFTSDMPMVVNEVYDRVDDAYSSKAEKARSSSANYSQSAVQEPECIQSVARNNFSPPAMLQFARTRKLSVERSESRRRALLEKRKFFHSHRAQPMSLEQVLADHDSEDEVDDDVADLEDRRMLDDFVDVTRDEKQIMHLWNSFIRKQRVLADGHIPWACEAFSRLHGPDLVQAPSVLWCWRLFMLKLWNHAMLDARAINNCNKILDQCQNLEPGPV